MYKFMIKKGLAIKHGLSKKISDICINGDEKMQYCILPKQYIPDKIKEKTLYLVSSKEGNIFYMKIMK